MLTRGFGQQKPIDVVQSWRTGVSIEKQIVDKNTMTAADSLQVVADESHPFWLAFNHPTNHNLVIRGKRKLTAFTLYKMVVSNRNLRRSVSFREGMF